MTTDTPETNVDTALNMFYIKDGQTFVRDGSNAADHGDTTLYDYARMLIKHHKADIDGTVDDLALGEDITDCLFDGPETIEGLIATLYTAVWALSMLRHRLKEYEDADEDGRLIHIPDVPDKDREGVRDLICDARAEWNHDPSVGLYGPNEDEEALLCAIIDGLLLKEKKK